MSVHPIKGAFHDKLERDRARLRDESGRGPEFTAARRHLSIMNPDKLDDLNRKWVSINALEKSNV